MRDLNQVTSDGFKIPTPRRPSAFKPFGSLESKVDRCRRLDAMANAQCLDTQIYYQNLLVKFLMNPKMLNAPERRILMQMPIIRQLMAQR